MPLVMKNTRSTMEEMLDSRVRHLCARRRAARASVQLRYALRNAMPPVVTIIGIVFWFLLGGAVLVETVFAWGGLGQYAVQSVVSSDYAPLQAVRAGHRDLHEPRVPARRPRLLPARPADQTVVTV